MDRIQSEAQANRAGRRVKVLVSVPNARGWIHKHVAQALMWTMCEKRYDVKIIMPTHQPYVHNLHLIRKDFLAGDFDFWLTMDDDNPPTRNPLDLVERDLDVIGFPTPVWANMKPGDYPIYLNALDVQEDGWTPHRDHRGLQEVDAVGSGCLLIARRVMEAIKAPFMRTWDEDGVVTHGGDYSFCRRAKEHGFKIWTDYRYPCLHFKEIELNEVAEAMGDFYA